MAKKSKTPRVFFGIPAAPGIAVGRARRLADPEVALEERRLPEKDVPTEIDRFRAALDQARGEISELRRNLSRDIGAEEARIFDFQILVLEDPMAVERTEEAIRRERLPAALLFRRHLREVADQLAQAQDPMFGERAIDLRDVERRVIRLLAGDRQTEVASVKRGVLLGREFAPSDCVLFDPSRVLGFASDHGGRTSHAAIMARARGIPAVVGLRGLSDAVQEGDMIALDGFQGRVEINPGPEVLKRLRARRQAFGRMQKHHARLLERPAETRDGVRIRLTANMEVPTEASIIQERGAEGVGLLRTEFFFMNRLGFPDEEEQVAAYRKLIRALRPREITIRVLDVGGDKVASYMGVPRERNPFLGMRGIRYLLAHPEVFRIQLRAILRAGADGPVKILLPMVTSVDELRTARNLVKRAVSVLKRRGLPHDPDPRLGVMIETPSAVFMAGELAREADFLSVGSNDLIQYLLAVDRDSETMPHLFQPLHPAVLRALHTASVAARAHRRPISMCGEMGADPMSVPLLIGLGFDEVSVSPTLLPEIKQTIRSLRAKDCRDLVVEALGASTADQIAELIEMRLGARFSDLLGISRDTNGLPAPRDT